MIRLAALVLLLLAAGVAWWPSTPADDCPADPDLLVCPLILDMAGTR